MTDVKIRILAQDNTSAAFKTATTNLEALTKSGDELNTSLHTALVTLASLSSPAPASVTNPGVAAVPQLPDFAGLERTRPLIEDFQGLNDAIGLDRLADQLTTNSALADGLALSLARVSEHASTNKTLADDLGSAFARSAERTIVKFEGVSKLIKNLETDILRIITNDLINKPLGNGLSDFLSGGNRAGDSGSRGTLDNYLSNLAKSIFSFDGGGYTGGGARAGGLDGRGGFLAVMHPRETVTDHTRGQSAGNTVNVTINQQFAAGTTRATTLQAAADARRQLEYSGRNL